MATHRYPKSYRSPRRRLNPALHEACRASGRPAWQLALATGIIHASKFSSLICAEKIPATPLNLERLHRIAEEVGFPKSQLFLFDEQTEAAS